MKRPESRIASLLVLLAACNGGVVEDPTNGTSETGEDTTSGDDTTGTPPTPTTTTVPTTGTTIDPTAETSDTSTTSETTVDDTTTTADDTTTSAGDTTTADDTTTGEPDTTTEMELCGNGALDPGEACDGDLFDGQTCMSEGFDDGTLACAADCTLDTSGCTLVSCGNGVIDDMEACDGDLLAGEDCLSQGFMGGTLACADNCGAFDTAACFGCGDDVINGTDVCDGIDLAGETCISQGFVAGELACQNDCSALDTSMCTSCGNDVADMGETCDGADLGGETCISQGFLTGELACLDSCDAYDTTSCSSCGNDVIDPPEVCDGNALGSGKCTDLGFQYGYVCCGDACAYDTSNCAAELLESEPNEDGSPSLNDDFSIVNADGPISSQTVVKATLGVAGDEDVYTITNDLDVPVLLTAETFGPNGPGTCPYNDDIVDTLIEIRNANAVILVQDDDAGIGYCSRVVNYQLAAKTTVYANVLHSFDDTAVPSYYFQVDLRPIVCGDGHLAPAEQCDDGNLVANDGCSATCTLDSLTAEVEPNGTAAEADASPVFSAGNSRFGGTIMPAADLDRYRIELAQPGWVRLETFTRGNDCPAGTTTSMRVFNAANVSQITDTAGAGIGSCSALVFPLPAGKSYVQIEETGLNAVIPQYVLDVKTLADGGMESEPNETQAAADVVPVGADVLIFGDHPNAMDVDFYAITVPECGSSLRLEIVEGDRAIETCESNGIDSFLTLFDAAGKQLEQSEDEGRGYCSLIDGTGVVPANPGANDLAAGTYYVRVQSGPIANMAQATFQYRLAATIRKP